LDKARKETGRDRIEIFMLHEQESEYTIKGHYEAIEFFLKKKQEGVIKAFGISTHRVAGVCAANQYDEIGIVFAIINHKGLGITDGTRNDMEDALKEAGQKGKGVMAMKPLGGGHLIKDAAAAFGYMDALPYVDAVAVGMQSEAELAFNCRYFGDGVFDETLYRRLSTTERRLFVHDWCIGCGCCARACPSGALTIKSGNVIINRERCVLCSYCAAVCPEFAIKVI